MAKLPLALRSRWGFAQLLLDADADAQVAIDKCLPIPIDILSLLLAAGAKPPVNISDTDGRTLLMRSAMSGGHRKNCSFFLMLAQDLGQKTSREGRRYLSQTRALHRVYRCAGPSRPWHGTRTRPQYAIPCVYNYGPRWESFQHHHCCELLIDKQVVNHQNHDSWCPLHLASIHQHNAVRLLLIDVDLGAPSPLCRATAYGHTEIVELLLKVGADIHLSDTHGRTPLLLAADRGHLNVITALLGLCSLVGLAAHRQVRLDGACICYCSGPRQCRDLITRQGIPIASMYMATLRFRWLLSMLTLKWSAYCFLTVPTSIIQADRVVSLFEYYSGSSVCHLSCVRDQP